jgi:hypothetical protein
MDEGLGAHISLSEVEQAARIGQRYRGPKRVVFVVNTDRFFLGHRATWRAAEHQPPAQGINFQMRPGARIQMPLTDRARNREDCRRPRSSAQSAACNVTPCLGIKCRY